MNLLFCLWITPGKPSRKQSECSAAKSKPVQVSATPRFLQKQNLKCFKVVPEYPQEKPEGENVLGHSQRNDLALSKFEFSEPKDTENITVLFIIPVEWNQVEKYSPAIF